MFEVHDRRPIIRLVLDKSTARTARMGGQVIRGVHGQVESGWGG